VQVVGFNDFGGVQTVGEHSHKHVCGFRTNGYKQRISGQLDRELKARIVPADSNELAAVKLGSALTVVAAHL
jgi:hypothetical protein